MPKAKKIIKKEKPKEITFIKKIGRSYIKVPLFGIIAFLFLLVAVSFVAAFSLFKKDQTTTNSSNNKLASENVFDAENSNKPELDFYVMSFCPYGNQMETTLRPVFDLLGDKVTLRPRYIFEKINGDLAAYCKSNYTSPYKESQCPDLIKQYPDQIKDITDCKKQLATIASQYKAQEKKCNDESQYLKIGNNLYTSLHGRIEANQDVRELCAYNLTTDKKLWWDFVKNVNDNCTAQNADTCWTEQATKAGLDASKITECFNKDASSLIEAEIADTTKNKVSGSPTLMIGDKNFPPEIDGNSTDQNIKIGNEVFSLSNIRTPNVIKAALCTGFNKTPKECKTVIKTDTTKQQASSTGGC